MLFPLPNQQCQSIEEQIVLILPNKILLLGGTAESDYVYCEWSIHLYVYHTHIRQNGMPCGRDTHVIRGIVLDGGAVPPQEGEIWELESPMCSSAIYCAYC